MGPNSIRLLDELKRKSPEDTCFDRTLDLGCGNALTSIFIANEMNTKIIYAFDLWISATENYKRIQENHLEDKIIPIQGNALKMPFAHDYFDAIISVDSYHYFACKEGVFSENILPFIKKGGYAMIAIPGIKEEPKGEIKEIFNTWVKGDDANLFKTTKWWENLLKKECGDLCNIVIKEAECFDIAWKEWFNSGHKYGIRDKEFLEKGLDKILNFILIYIRKN